MIPHISIVLAAVTMVLGSMTYKIYSLNQEIDQYQKKLESSQTLLLGCTDNVLRLTHAVDFQNKEIATLTKRYEDALNVKPTTIVETKERLKIVYRDRNVTQEECKHVSSVIDAIRRTGI
jgi:hypothetical protein